MRIQISYDVEHRSTFGISKETHTATYKPDHSNNFTIACLNRECTCGFFDMKDEIRRMIYSKQSDYSGEIGCEGSEAPDHMSQSCGGTLKYTIIVAYKTEE